MTPAAFRKLALSFPGVTEAPHFDRTAFRVKTIFATVKDGADEAMVRVAPPGFVDALLRDHPQVFFSYGGFTRAHGSLGVRLSKIDAPRMRELLTAAWERAAPKKKAARRRG